MQQSLYQYLLPPCAISYMQIALAQGNQTGGAAGGTNQSSSNSTSSGGAATGGSTSVTGGSSIYWVTIQ